MSEHIDETDAVETHDEWAIRKAREKMKVTRYQAKAVLMHAGLLEVVEQAIAATDDPLMTLAWEEASFDRMSPLIAEMKTVIGLTEEQVDDLFRAASEVT